MNRLEFEEQLIKYAGDKGNVRAFTEEEYVKIEYVYIWHPAINPVGGKRQIVILWQEFGMGMINDMYPVASKMQTLEDDRSRCQRSLNEVDKKISDFMQSYR